MGEPDYTAQTFEPKHLADPAAARQWFSDRGREAHERGCVYPRFTVNDDQTGLLFEAWIDRPDDMGNPRWMMSAQSK